MKKYHVLLIATLATLGLSACDKGNSPEEGSVPAVEESTMSDTIENTAGDAINIIEETVEDASETVDQMMEDMGIDNEAGLSDAMEKMKND